MAMRNSSLTRHLLKALKARHGYGHIRPQTPDQDQVNYWYQRNMLNSKGQTPPRAFPGALGARVEAAGTYAHNKSERMTLLNWCLPPRPFVCSLPVELRRDWFSGTTSIAHAISNGGFVRSLFNSSSSPPKMWKSVIANKILELNASNTWVVHQLGWSAEEAAIAEMVNEYARTGQPIALPTGHEVLATVVELIDQLLPVGASNTSQHTPWRCSAANASQALKKACCLA
jgi:hypothetical protein